MPGRLRPVDDLPATPEQAQFVGDGGALALFRAPPRGGKTTALKMRARYVGRPVIWTAPVATSRGLPRGSRVLTLARLCAEVVRREPSLVSSGGLRVPDHEEVRRIFTLVMRGTLPGDIETWRKAYQTAKRIRVTRTKAGLLAVAMRHGLLSDDYDAVELLERSLEQTDRALADSGLRSPQDMVLDVAHRLHAQAAIARQLVPRGMVLSVDDAQTLSTAEMTLIQGLARHGVEVSASLGTFQCATLGHGAVALSWESRLRAMGFAVTDARTAVGLSREQASRLVQVLDKERAPPFEGTGGDSFAVSFASHDDEGLLFQAVVASITDRVRAGIRMRDNAVLCATSGLAVLAATRLQAAGLPVELRGRGYGESSPAFVVANAAVNACRNVRDLLSLRQVALLFIYDRQAAERLLVRAAQTGCTVAEAVAQLPDDDTSREAQAMCDALGQLRAAGPSRVAEWMRAAPYWPADAVNEAGLTWWADRVYRAGGLSGWDSAAWPALLSLTADATDERPLPAEAVCVLAVSDSCGMAWSHVDVVGVSNGLIPAHVVNSERMLETHVLVQALSRARSSAHLHHARQMRLEPDGPEVKLQASPYVARLGFEVPSGPRDEQALRFKMREQLRP